MYIEAYNTKFSKAAGHKINKQISNVFLYTSNEQSKIKLGKQFHFKSIKN